MAGDSFVVVVVVVVVAGGVDVVVVPCSFVEVAMFVVGLDSSHAFLRDFVLRSMYFISPAKGSSDSYFLVVVSSNWYPVSGYSSWIGRTHLSSWPFFPVERFIGPPDILRAPLGSGCGTHVSFPYIVFSFLCLHARELRANIN